MALSTRELMLVLRARDEASKVLRGAAGSITSVSAASAQAAQKQIAQGAALTTIGVATAAAGLAAIKWLDDATKAAMEYNNQSRLTLTQVDQVGVKLSTIKDIGKEVAAQVPVDFKKIQNSLYDIFSSMDVTVPQAKMLLTEFSKAAVAGQVDLQDASRATIGIMNAYGMKAEDVNHVNDVMFELVRKGVGTYGEFANTIGRAVPSAVRAGQSVETLAGMMAFLTRNGLSAAMASASAGRALDAISNPKTIQHFDNLGGSIEKALGKDRAISLFGKNYKSMSIDIKDAHGNIKPMPEIMTALGKSIGNLPNADRAAVLQELFKSSGGTIQARRFFDVAVTQFGQFNKLTQDMINSKGAMAEAYKVMFDDPQVKMQLLSNQWNILKTNVGDAILPIKMAIVDVFMKLIDAFNQLSPTMQQGIVIFLGLVGVLLVLVGVITAIAGLWLMLSGAAALAGTTIAAIAGPIALVIAAILAVAAAIYLVWKYHDELWAVVQRVWGYIKPIIQPVIDTIINMYNAIKDLVVPMFEKMWQTLKESLEPAMDRLRAAWDKLVEGGKKIWDALQPLMPIFEMLGKIIAVVLVSAIMAFIGAIMIVINVAAGVLGPAIEMVAGIIEGLVDTIVGMVRLVIAVITGDWAGAWDAAKQIVVGEWEIIWSVISGAVGTIVGAVKGLWDGVVAVFQWAYDIIVGHSIVPDMVTAIITWIATLPSKVISAVTSLLTSFAKWATDVMKRGYDAFVSGVNTLITFVTSLPGKVINAISSLGNQMYNAGVNALTQLYQGAVNAGQKVLDYVRGLANDVRNLWPFSPAKAGPLRQYPLNKAGANMMNMLASGINSRKKLVLDSMKNIAGDVAMTASNMQPSGPVVPYYGGGPGDNSGGNTYQQIDIHTQEIDPAKHAADLGFELARRTGK
jgi:TP901 family phage tail tape measure protein